MKSAVPAETSMPEDRAFDYWQPTTACWQQLIDHRRGRVAGWDRSSLDLKAQLLPDWDRAVVGRQLQHLTQRCQTTGFL